MVCLKKYIQEINSAEHTPETAVGRMLAQPTAIHAKSPINMPPQPSVRVCFNRE